MLDDSRNMEMTPSAEQNSQNIEADLSARFGKSVRAAPPAKDNIPTFWVDKAAIVSILDYLKNKAEIPYKMLYDLTAIDERSHQHRNGGPDCLFSVVYHLISFDGNIDIRLKVPLYDEIPSLPSVTGVWMTANWYEREIWDMFGIKFDGHPNLRRILMPVTWSGHPLRKEHPARATEMEPFTLPDWKQDMEQDALQFRPEDWGMRRQSEDADFMFLNLGPQHPGSHGILRLVLQLDGEEIVDVVPDIGFHHRGAEKMGERQTWHTFIQYTDRIDYLSGVVNNFPYVMAVETLGGIEIPERAQVIRVMMAELYRIASHLVWLGTFAQDLGAMSPVFYMFNDRERIFQISEAITGGRMHPGWFRIGGVAADLPQGWDSLINEFLAYMPPRLKEYEDLVLKNRIFKARTIGIGAFNTAQAIEWGVTGPNLRATGLNWDYRKMRPYSSYDKFDFEIPTAIEGDCYARSLVRIEEMRQSLRIVRQCLDNMPSGHYKSDHPLTTPPRKEKTMHDIETLINHFLNVSWGPVMPPGEASVGAEGAKGMNHYYLVSEGNTESYRTRIRTPSFPHMQILPMISRGHLQSNLLAILGSIDYVLADVDR